MSAQPFTFDNDFGDGPAVASAPKRKRVYLAEEVEALLAAARREGEASVTAAAAQAQAQALAALAAAAQQGLSALAQVAVEHKSGAAELALIAARRIADAALERFPDAPVRAALESLAREVEAQPRLVCRMANLGEELQASVEQAARDSGFAGQIVFREEPVLGTAAFRLEWGDGKASFDPDETAQRIADAFHDALAAEGLHGEPHLPPTGA